MLARFSRYRKIKISCLCLKPISTLYLSGRETRFNPDPVFRPECCDSGSLLRPVPGAGRFLAFGFLHIQGRKTQIRRGLMG
jgi:hypothetical protein